VNEVKKLKDAAARDRFFTELAQKKAQTAGASGLALVLWKSPPRAEVVVGPQTPEEKFTLADRDALRRKLNSRHLPGKPDATLLEGLDLVRETLDKAGQPMIWPWVLAIVLGVLGVWLVIGLLRGRGAAPVPQGPAGGAPLGPGGLWIGQSPFARPSQAAAPDHAEPPAPPPAENPAPADSVKDQGELADPDSWHPHDGRSSP
jgi:hypothetical protein